MENKQIELLVQANTLLGEFIGTLKGLLHWDIPEELQSRIRTQIEKLEQTKIVNVISDDNGWIPYDWNNLETRPKKTEKYFVHRKDGKVYWEKWNGSGWAYNGNVITHYMEVKGPYSE